MKSEADEDEWCCSETLWRRPWLVLVFRSAAETMGAMKAKPDELTNSRGRMKRIQISIKKAIIGANEAIASVRAKPKMA